MAAAGHRWLLGAGRMASATEELDFIFHLILISLNVNSHMWLPATVVDNAVLEHILKIHFCFISQVTANPIVKINAVM